MAPALLSAKICSAGGLLKGERKSYGFDTDDGAIALPQGQEAYILSFTEKGQQIYFGMSCFVTGKNNEVVVNTSPVTAAEMNLKLKELDFEALSIKAEQAKNAATLKKLDLKLKDYGAIKPKGSDCDCFTREGTR